MGLTMCVRVGMGGPRIAGHVCSSAGMTRSLPPKEIPGYR